MSEENNSRVVCIHLIACIYFRSCHSEPGFSFLISEDVGHPLGQFMTNIRSTGQNALLL